MDQAAFNDMIKGFGFMAIERPKYTLTLTGPNHKVTVDISPDVAFYCPICTENGDPTCINILTLSEHMYAHFTS